MVISSHDASLDLLSDNYETKFSKERCSSLSTFLLGLFTCWAMALQFSSGCHCVEESWEIASQLPLYVLNAWPLMLGKIFSLLTSQIQCSATETSAYLAWYLQSLKQEGRILRKKDFGEQCQSSCSFLVTATSVIAGTAGNNIMLAWIEIHHMLWYNSDRVFEVHKQVQSFALVHSSVAGCCRDHWRKSLHTIFFHTSFSGFPGSLILSLCSQ